MLDLWRLLKRTLKHLNSTVWMSLSADLDRDGRAPVARLHRVTTRTEHKEVCYGGCQLNQTATVLKRVSSIYLVFFVLWQSGDLNS